jgi:cytochrome c-type biogenesis protein CcmF
MDIGAVLIYIAFFLAIGGAFLSFISAFLFRQSTLGEVNTISFLSKLISILIFCTVSVALLLLYQYFMSSNINIEYVWEYSSRSLSGEYKFSGVLAGMSGSLLFWIWCITLSWFVEEIIDLRKPKSKMLMAVTRTFMLAITAVFLYFLVLRDVFKETSQEALNFAPDGQGLNPLLQTPLMIVHPPIVFLAYGFCVIALASSFAYLFTNDKKWVNISIPWSRWAWFFLTLGIGIGGLWAYVVLGWGGYWAWDPVETSSFLPWILLTAFLHAQIMNKRKRDYKYAAPALGIYTFVLVIFATFTTRAGGIWQSVHAFGSADVNVSAFDRFVEVTTSDGIILGYFVFMWILAIGGAIVLVWSLIRRGGWDEDLSPRQQKSVMEELINDRSLMFLTLIVFVISTIITLLLLILSINGADRTQFDTKVGFFAMVGIVVLVACLAWKYLGRRMMLYSLLFCGAIAVVLFALFPDNMMVVLTMPFLVLALGASIFKIIKSVNRKSLRGTINNISPHIIHLGLVLIIIGFVGSNFLVTDQDITLTLNGDSEKVGAYEFRMVESSFSSDESIFVTIEISANGNKIGEARPGAIFLEDQWRNEIDVVGLPHEDIYLVFIDGDIGSSGTTVSSVNLQVKILPWMSLLWTGMWLLAVGILIRLVVDYTRPRISPQSSRIQKRARMRTQMEQEEQEEFDEDEPYEPEDIEDKSDEYYDDLIEDELRKME